MSLVSCENVVAKGESAVCGPCGQAKEAAAFCNSITSGVQAYKAKTKVMLAEWRSAITYRLSGGRFGDNLIAYLHAKWFSYKYAIPLIYIPFEYSSDLLLSDAELMVTADNANCLTRHATIKKLWLNTMAINSNAGVLYVVPWFSESLQDYERPDGWSIYSYVNWNDQNFLKEVCPLIAPRKQLELIKLPPDKVSVAVHVRRNSNGFDLPLSYQQGGQIDTGKKYLDDYFPFKCVSDDFYIFSIKKMAELFPDKQLYVYLFTDDKHPDRIAEKYKKIINNPAITVDYRHDVHDHTRHVLEDFFSMLTFDCLIRSDSNFSLVASKLGKHKFVISPGGYDLVNGHPVMVKADISARIAA